MFHRLLSRSLLIVALLPLTALGAGFPQLGTLAEDGFRISAEARLLASGEQPATSLASISPTRSLSPASVTKVYTAAAALDRLGPQHRFTTRLVSTAAPGADGVLAGDLILDGGGDPALTSEDLWRLVQRLHQAGVREVAGRLVVSQWRFGPVECITTDRCRTRRRSSNAYSALLSSAGVNFGSWCVNVAPAASAGKPAVLTSCDSKVPLPGFDNQVETQPADSGTRLSATRVTQQAGDVMQVSGQISINAYPRDLYRASADPAGQTADLLLAMLERAGIQVRGEAVTSTTQPPASAQQLAAVDGEPLQEVLLRTLNYSNNFMADVLALNLANGARPDLAAGGAVIQAFASGIEGHGPLTLRSGSGLTTDNRTSASGANTLLAHMFEQPALFPSFVAALQSPSNGVMRFIRKGPATFQNRVMLKTGTLNEPVRVRAVTGYFRTRSNRWGAFTVLVNGTDSTPYLNWTMVLERLAEDLTSLIETH
ncbi:D-alanyl-D-alanine carboxypeptidase/D-alanyl-D-alanine-endopeptidase [Halomonas sp. 18H]|uniref:D-alanyl-D-alanine carboxypeptidase/D-alanyl-D-alanine endopeptidase n=1 Tax=Halomonas almeriensis TaxID=308163 RepID=UPI00222ED5E0|nr:MULTISPECIES: D-alanyl-D-alanine carboxypeptidase/D-alanyl-D-alanine-endopeptidase [Halomonas]MCW4152565.1 D-alanyl-D-alanine carboxypeptidase/D-alanyl-D-alanine-endopeptidase [Halomonas sp. 18H]MDN3553859.1 D-alanyl-D-alanine carboxypeptidase/D-alanyl-D-alanine-endopeptidase [Halomonas almeriensis]